ncbi:hypothetical protein HaLaN_16931, partial [Haematococcus lacustris]
MGRLANLLGGWVRRGLHKLVGSRGEGCHKAGPAARPEVGLPCWPTVLLQPPTTLRRSSWVMQ